MDCNDVQNRQKCQGIDTQGAADEEDAVSASVLDVAKFVPAASDAMVFGSSSASSSKLERATAASKAEKKADQGCADMMKFFVSKKTGSLAKLMGRCGLHRAVVETAFETVWLCRVRAPLAI